MRFVYATRSLPQLQFATATRRERIPDDAEVYAVCDGALTIRQPDQDALSKLTVHEHSVLQELITESQRAEFAAARTVIIAGENPLRRILHRLLAL